MRVSYNDQIELQGMIQDFLIDKGYEDDETLEDLVEVHVTEIIDEIDANGSKPTTK